AILGEAFNILTQAPATVDPGDRALDDPTARLHLKADLVGRGGYNLDRDTQHLCSPFDHITTIALVSPGIAHGWTQFLRLVQCWLHTIPILDVRGVNHHRQQIAFGIDDE